MLPSNRLRFALIFLVVVALLGSVCLTRRTDSWPQPLAFTLTIPASLAPQRVELLHTGYGGTSDSISLQLLDGQKARFHYVATDAPSCDSEIFSLPPDTPLSLIIAVPDKSYSGSAIATTSGILRISVAGREVMAAPALFHGGRNSPIYFGPEISFEPAGPETRKGIRLHNPEGWLAQGQYRARTALSSRLVAWFKQAPGKAVVIVLFAAIASSWLARPRPLDPVRKLSGELRTFAVQNKVTVFLIGLSLIPYAFMLSEGHWNPLYPAPLGSYYEQHAEGLLAGSVAVSPESIGSEAFLFEGKYYSYYGPTPALFRLPHALFNLPYGRSTRVYMLLYYALTLFAVAGILRTFAALVLPEGKSLYQFISHSLLLAFALGSPFYFLSNRANLSNEAIGAGTMFSVFCIAALLRYLFSDSRKMLWLSWLCGSLAILSRPTVGLSALSFACVLLGVSFLFRLPGAVNAPPGNTFQPRWGRLAFASLFFLTAFLPSLVSYLKFKEFSGCPLKYYVQFSQAPERLAHIGGKNFQAANMRANADFYFLRNNLEVSSSFPYFLYVPPGRRENLADEQERWAHSGTGLGGSTLYPEAKLDWFEPTVGLPYCSPLLLAMGTLGLFVSALGNRRLLSYFGIVLISVVPPGILLLTLLAIAHRYTIDFMPLLAVYAALGAVAVASLKMDRFRRGGLLLGITALGIYGVVVNFFLAFREQGEISPPDETAKARYAYLKSHLD